MAKLTMIKAITNALDEELGRDDKVQIFGEDVGKNGGVFRATDGLQKKYGAERVYDTPLAESGIIGLANGLAMQGFRPIPEIQFMGFVLEAFDQIAGQLARERFRMGGSRNFPVTIRTPFGGGVHTPELHSDSFEGLVAQVPGLRVVVPSGPYDAKGLLISSIRSDDPVIFLEHMKLYRSVKEEVPDEAYTVALDQAAVKREGTDVSIITYGYMVQASLQAAADLAKDGINAEVVDLRTIAPLDEETHCVKSLMMTTGLYNQSDTYSRLIGVPTKSVVVGGLMSAAPHKCGIGIFSPALDKDGNSIAGLDLLRDIVDGLELDVFD